MPLYWLGQGKINRALAHAHDSRTNDGVCGSVMPLLLLLLSGWWWGGGVCSFFFLFFVFFVFVLARKIDVGPAAERFVTSTHFFPSDKVIQRAAMPGRLVTRGDKSGSRCTFLECNLKIRGCVI